MNIEYAELSENDSYLRDLGHGIWLMDDHRWAASVWEVFREQSAISKFSLIHADYHWDGIYDFHGDPEEEARLLVASVADIQRYVSEGHWIRFDSFIAPVVRRGMFDEVHFFCKQDDGSDTDRGLDEDLLQNSGVVQHIHSTAVDIAKYPYRSPIIFDLCLDLFNRSNGNMFEGEIWGDDQICEFLNTMKSTIQNAVVVTVSLSFGYSGAESDTRRLAEFILPKLVEFRNQR